MRVYEAIVKVLEGIGVEAAFGGAGENARGRRRRVRGGRRRRVGGGRRRRVSGGRRDGAADVVGVAVGA
jgi:hypothetical protein